MGIFALSGPELQVLLDEACALVARTLSVEYAKVLELLPDGERLLLRSGVGWMDGYVGRATVGTNLESQAGYTLISEGPVVVENLREEVRFKGAPLLHDHRVTSGVTVAILLEDRHFGVLSAHTSRKRAFADHEILFLQDVADVLGAAIERKLGEDDSRKKVTEQSERAEAAERRFEFLAGANALLSASSHLDYAAVLDTTARLAVPAVADWCFVDVLESGGRIHRAVVGTSGSGDAKLAEGLRQKYPLDPNLPHGTPRVLRTGRSELLPEIDDPVLRSIARDAEHLGVLRRLKPRSYMCVPLRGRRRPTGAIGFVSAESDRRYGPDDLALAEGLAHCAGLAIDHALNRVPEEEMAREILRLSGRGRTVVAPSADAPELTRRQLEVLNLMAEGMPAREISRKLHLSEATVRNHVRSVKQALGARSQLEALAQARKLGVLPR
ncbi:GAF domain-containing protein [Rubrobacter marinus]|uniref:GAF domain-containing protein n=1 Tax=Rubrobacter marinus TaxID=2653852 RepID=A0A6G8PW13_9ACTN|nr:GAF domain-containing protein [Rubrobacter marinus]QIN78394.1 GAF domain-containing protein [Rubrobacter marinus]